jgi:hypothetical protein
MPQCGQNGSWNCSNKICNNNTTTRKHAAEIEVINATNIQ